MAGVRVRDRHEGAPASLDSGSEAGMTDAPRACGVGCRSVELARNFNGQLRCFACGLINSLEKDLDSK